MSTILTIDQFNKIPLGCRFRTVIDTTNTFLTSKPTKVIYVAIKSEGYPDWTIYGMKVNHPSASLIDLTQLATTNGEKLHTESYIRNIVPCDDEVFSMYRQ